MTRSISVDDIHFTRWLFRAYLLLLFLCTLPLGSNRPWFWSLLVIIAALIALLWAFGWLAGITHITGAAKRARLPLFLLLGFCLWTGLQLLPASWLPGFLVPGFFHDAYGFVDLPPRLSVDRQATSDALLLSFGIMLLATLTTLLVVSKRRALLVLYLFTLAGLFQALYGSLMVLSGLEIGFLEPKQYGLGLATGTFINRNHYANFLVLSLSASMGLLLAQMDLEGTANLRQRVRGFLQTLLGPKARLRVYMVIMVIAVVLTHSRMGNAAFFAALTFVSLFALWRLKKPSKPLLILVVSVLIIDLFLVGTWFGMEKVIDRIQNTVQVENDVWLISDQSRLETNRESFAIISQSPATGMGAGSFYTVYPAWRGVDQGFLDHAHNDYLEFTVETGIVGAAFLALFMVLCIRKGIKGLDDRNRPGRFGVSFASLMAIVAMLIHANVDFSLQIPANASWFVVLCILPFSVDSRKRSRKRQSSH